MMMLGSDGARVLKGEEEEDIEDDWILDDGNGAGGGGGGVPEVVRAPVQPQPQLASQRDRRLPLVEAPSPPPHHQVPTAVLSPSKESASASKEPKDKEITPKKRSKSTKKSSSSKSSNGPTKGGEVPVPVPTIKAPSLRAHHSHSKDSTSSSGSYYPFPASRDENGEEWDDANAGEGEEDGSDPQSQSHWGRERAVTQRPYNTHHIQQQQQTHPTRQQSQTNQRLSPFPVREDDLDAEDEEYYSTTQSTQNWERERTATTVAYEKVHPSVAAAGGAGASANSTNGGSRINTTRARDGGRTKSGGVKGINME
jgi:hypothetical protein